MNEASPAGGSAQEPVGPWALPEGWRPDGDVDVLAERGQQADQAVAGEIGQAAVEQGRNLRLVDAHQRRHRDLGRTPALAHRNFELGLKFILVEQAGVS